MRLVDRLNSCLWTFYTHVLNTYLKVAARDRQKLTLKTDKKCSCTDPSGILMLKLMNVFG